jgi:hypothetical protein
MTDQQSNKPVTATEAFEAAGENLRQAEKGWNDTRVPDASVSQVIDIANAWTALGIGLSNAEPFDSGFPIPISLVGMDHPTRSSFADRVGTHRIGLGDGCAACGLTKEQAYVAAARGESCRGLSPMAHVHSRPLCNHTWLSPMEPCANGCGARPEEGRSHLPCPKTCPDVTA